MMYSTGQLSIIAFIIVEVALVFLFIVLVYVTKIIFLLRTYYDHYKRKHYLRLLSKYQKDGACRPFYRIGAPELLLTLVNQQALSKAQKTALIEKVILPKVQRYQFSKNWQKRYTLLSALKHGLRREHYPSLVRLIDDAIPIISIEAARLGSSTNDWTIYQAILNLLLRCDHSKRIIYIDNFHKNKAIRPFLLQQLRQHNDSQLRKIMYDLLLHVGCDTTFYEMVKRDSIGGHQNMRLAAIRILPGTDRKKAGATLQSLVHDSDWLVRNVAVQSLGMLGDDQYIPVVIECLNDPVWWVRVSAAKALAAFGDIGVQLLQDDAENISAAMSDYAEYFLKIKQLKSD
ncbi:MAG: HEAT repeat domain-containing protein [Legionellaceae bacterium]|nr:HEAT repeat domain-containing protein [Legionellaceae bacterium]